MTSSILRSSALPPEQHATAPDTTDTANVALSRADTVPDTPLDAPVGIPGRPQTRAECDLVSARLAALSDRLREQVQAGLPTERYATARICVEALEAAQSLIGEMRLSIGPDSAHARMPPKH